MESSPLNINLPTRAIIDWDEIFQNGLTGLIEDSIIINIPIANEVDDVVTADTMAPNQESAAEKLTDVAIAFFKIFDEINSNRITARQDLEILLKKLPNLVWIERKGKDEDVNQIADDDNNFELYFSRNEVIKCIREKPTLFTRPLIFTSFERALKHAGMYVTQTTHGTNLIKSWMFKTDKKSRKKRDRDDEELIIKKDNNYSKPIALPPALIIPNF